MQCKESDKNFEHLGHQVTHLERMNEHSKCLQLSRINS